MVVSKFADHMPLHRLHGIYARSGVDIPTSTLSDWIAGVGDLVEPLVTFLEKRVLGAYVVRTDATGLQVLDHTSPSNVQRGTIWAVVGDDRDVVFRFAGHRAGVTADALAMVDHESVAHARPLTSPGPARPTTPSRRSAR